LSQRQGAPLKSGAAHYICSMSEHREIELKTAALRGLLGRCPAAAKATDAQLSQAGGELCRLRRKLRPDPRRRCRALATIILVGHVFLPLAFMVDVDWMPTWAVG
jgi:uncharacterized protein (DUF983 family)